MHDLRIKGDHDRKSYTAEERNALATIYAYYAGVEVRKRLEHPDAPERAEKEALQVVLVFANEYYPEVSIEDVTIP